MTPRSPMAKITNHHCERPPPSPSQRRSPRCKKCQNPRLGHPRAGCPLFDTPISSSSPCRAMTPSVDIVNALASLKISTDFVSSNGSQKKYTLIRALDDPPPKSPISPVRSEELDKFLSSLLNDSNSSAYDVPMEEVDKLRNKAVQNNLCFRVIPFKSKDGEDQSNSRAMLVLGKDEIAVKRLSEQIETDKTKWKPRLNLGTAASGAMLGAVGAWAGLAFY